MINVLLPLAGRSSFFPAEEYIYPKPLIEICGRPMIQLVVENLRRIDEDVKFIFIVSKEDSQLYSLDDVVRLLDPCCAIVRLQGDTAGALCSCLSAVGHMDLDEELVIANTDQIIDSDLPQLIAQFRNGKSDAGVLTFEAVHPRWSFVRLENERIVEVAEKKPISKDAIAGFYYFRTGALFIEAAKKVILRGETIDGAYYISFVYNELVLDGMNLHVQRLKNTEYHTFYTPQKIHEYEEYMKRNGTP